MGGSVFPKEGKMVGSQTIEGSKYSLWSLVIWKLLSQNPSLWVNWVHKHLIREGSFWTAVDGKVS